MPNDAPSGRRPLARTRALIDAVDDGLVLLLAARRRLARTAAERKQAAGLPLVDPERESCVRRRAAALASHLGVPAHSAQALIDIAIADARSSQGLASDLDQGGSGQGTGMIAPRMYRTRTRSVPPSRGWLRWLPPPARWTPLLRACPPAVQRRLLERAMARVLAVPVAKGALSFLDGRRLGIDVTDLDLHWVVTLDRGRLKAVDQAAEASVRGSATDLLLLAGRLEDADTLFFQRRLVLTGDTELGLTARNLLDGLPWEQIPLGLRIVLNRGARLARDAREAHRAACG